MNAPVPIAFAGADNTLNTGDDLASVDIGGFRFTLNARRRRRPRHPRRSRLRRRRNRHDLPALLRLRRPLRHHPTISSLPTSTPPSAAPAPTGVAHEIQPDVDVFKLNNGRFHRPPAHASAPPSSSPSSAPTSASQATPLLQDLRGNVQFGIFDITDSTGIGDADLLAAPHVIPIGGTPNQITSDGVTSYGFDGNGDFFIEFIVPAHQGSTPGRFAVYVQGAIRTDYQLQITTQGTGSAVRGSQNLLIETRGGVIDWLEAGGITTTIGGFKSSVVGFSGPHQRRRPSTTTSSTISSPTFNDVFAAANIDINISSDPGAFAGQEFSTVFVTGSSEPVGFFDNGTFGASEHFDAFNADHNDEGVVFPPLSRRSWVHPQPGRRRPLRPVPHRRPSAVASASSPASASSTRTSPAPTTSCPSTRSATAAGPFRFSNQSVNLSPPELTPLFVFGTSTGRFSFLNLGLDRAINTDFYLGRQNSVNLLDRLLLPSQ